MALMILTQISASQERHTRLLLVIYSRGLFVARLTGFIQLPSPAGRALKICSRRFEFEGKNSTVDRIYKVKFQLIPQECLLLLSHNNTMGRYFYLILLILFKRIISNKIRIAHLLCSESALFFVTATLLRH